jgi:hypothetical protein
LLFVNLEWPTLMTAWAGTWAHFSGIVLLKWPEAHATAQASEIDHFELWEDSRPACYHLRKCAAHLGEVGGFRLKSTGSRAPFTRTSLGIGQYNNAEFGWLKPC